MSFVYIARSAEAVAARASQKFDGAVSPTAVEKFLQPTFVETRRAYIECAGCGHWRCQHCTRRKLKPGQVPAHTPWKGFTDDNGEIVPCSHTLPDAKAYICTSSACATILGTGTDEHFCECPKFISPNAKKRTAAPRTSALPDGIKHGGLIPRAALQAAHENYRREQTKQQPAPKTKEALLLEAAAEADLTALPVKDIAALTSMSAAWVRKILRAHNLLAPAKPRKTTSTLSTTGTPVSNENASQNWKEIICTS